MSRRDEWYRPNLLYNIHWRSPYMMHKEHSMESDDVTKAIVIKQSNPSQCTCEHHDQEVKYRTTSEFITYVDELEKQIKLHNICTAWSGGRMKLRVNVLNKSEKPQRSETLIASQDENGSENMESDSTEVVESSSEKDFSECTSTGSEVVNEGEIVSEGENVSEHARDYEGDSDCESEFVSEEENVHAHKCDYESDSDCESEFVSEGENVHAHKCDYESVSDCESEFVCEGENVHAHKCDYESDSDCESEFVSEGGKVHAHKCDYESDSDCESEFVSEGEKVHAHKCDYESVSDCESEFVSESLSENEQISEHVCEVVNECVCEVVDVLIDETESVHADKYTSELMSENMSDRGVASEVSDTVGKTISENISKNESELAREIESKIVSVNESDFVSEKDRMSNMRCGVLCEQCRNILANKPACRNDCIEEKLSVNSTETSEWSSCDSIHTTDTESSDLSETREANLDDTVCDNGCIIKANVNAKNVCDNDSVTIVDGKENNVLNVIENCKVETEESSDSNSLLEVDKVDLDMVKEAVKKCRHCLTYDQGAGDTSIVNSDTCDCKNIKLDRNESGINGHVFDSLENNYSTIYLKNETSDDLCGILRIYCGE